MFVAHQLDGSLVYESVRKALLAAFPHRSRSGLCVRFGQPPPHHRPSEPLHYGRGRALAHTPAAISCYLRLKKLKV